jgi:hypothetical protein
MGREARGLLEVVESLVVGWWRSWGYWLANDGEDNKPKSCYKLEMKAKLNQMVD